MLLPDVMGGIKSKVFDDEDKKNDEETNKVITKKKSNTIGTSQSNKQSSSSLLSPPPNSSPPSLSQPTPSPTPPSLILPENDSNMQKVNSIQTSTTSLSLPNLMSSPIENENKMPNESENLKPISLSHSSIIDLKTAEAMHKQKIRSHHLFDKQQEESNDDYKTMNDNSVASFQPPLSLQKSQYFRSFRSASKRFFTLRTKSGKETQDILNQEDTSVVIADKNKSDSGLNTKENKENINRTYKSKSQSDLFRFRLRVDSNSKKQVNEIKEIEQKLEATVLDDNEKLEKSNTDFDTISGSSRLVNSKLNRRIKDIKERDRIKSIHLMGQEESLNCVDKKNKSPDKEMFTSRSRSRIEGEINDGLYPSLNEIYPKEPTKTTASKQRSASAEFEPSNDLDAEEIKHSNNDSLIDSLKKQIDMMNQQIEDIGKEDWKIINKLSEKIDELSKMNLVKKIFLIILRL